MIVIVLAIAIPLCAIVIAIGCLDCLFKKKGFRSRDLADAENNTGFPVDVCVIPGTSEQVTIEPLPDIVSKVSSVPVLRPRITCVAAKSEISLPAASLQQSFPRDHLTYLNEIGSGWFGKVIESQAVQIGGRNYMSHVVVKVLKDDASKLEQKQFLEEASAFRNLEHPNLINLLGQCTEVTPFLIILEFAAHGNLKSFLLEHKENEDELFAKNRLVNFAQNAASGLACLHKHGYIHNDLAARTCMVMSDFTIKIGDYGISDRLFTNEYYNTGTQLLPVRWMAPEALIQREGTWTSQKCDTISDMWSFGVLLWEICSLGERPYDKLTDEAVLQQVVRDRIMLPSDVALKIPYKDRMWSIMVQCWQDTSRRLSAEQACSILSEMSTSKLESMADFDQKWNHLKQNHARMSSNGSDIGSKTGLAGSFDKGSSSSLSDKPSILDGDNEAFDGITHDNHMIDMSDSSRPASGGSFDSGHIVPNILVQSKNTADPSLTIQDDLSFAKNNQVILESELTKSPQTPIQNFVRISPDQQITTSTPFAQGINATPQTRSEDSTLSSQYVSANDTFDASIIQMEDVIEVRDKSSDLQKDVSDKRVSSEVDMTEHTKEDEDFSDFVRTSPTGPGVDFTDFESAPSDSFVKVQLVLNEDLIIENEPSSFPHETNANENFSEFSASADVISNADNDGDSFSEFVTSGSPVKLPSTNNLIQDTDGTMLKNTLDDKAHNPGGSSLDRGTLTSEMHIIEPLPESRSKEDKTSTDILDKDSKPQEHTTNENIEHKGEKSSGSMSDSRENKSIVKPEQNQELLSLEQISPHSIPIFPSLTPDSFLQVDENQAGTVTEVSNMQPSLTQNFSDFKEYTGETNDPESFHPHNTEDRSSDHQVEQNNNTFDFLDDAFSNSLQSADPVASIEADKMHKNLEKESDNSGEKSNRPSDSVDSVLDLNLQQKISSQNGSSLLSADHKEQVIDAHIESTEPTDNH